VREAWRRARIGLASPRGLVLPAARLGLPGALQSAIFRLEDPWEGPDLRRNQSYVKELAELTGYDGPLENGPAWLAAHAAEFRYDPATGRYRGE
ncbi:MAG: hypothetical protein D6766_12660, partial [Verrucomicrobia bacterium]